MSGYVDHGWRHAPKSQGGTDPAPSGGGGIQFETDNTGHWLAIYTDAANDFDGILLSAQGGKVTISSFDDDVQIRAGGDLNMQHDGDFFVEGTGGQGFAPDTYFDVSCGTNLALNAGNNLTMTAVGNTTIAIGSGNLFRVRDSSGNPVLEVRDDGTVHILTGGTVVADL